MSFILQNVGLILLGPRRSPSRTCSPRNRCLAFPSGAILVRDEHLIVLGVTIPLLIVLRWFVRSTRQGKAMRATAQDREASA